MQKKYYVYTSAKYGCDFSDEDIGHNEQSESANQVTSTYNYTIIGSSKRFSRFHRGKIVGVFGHKDTHWFQVKWGGYHTPEWEREHMLNRDKGH